MRTAIMATVIACCAVLTPNIASGQGVFVNGVSVSRESIEALQQRLGIPTAAAIPDGRYWYDSFSGLWGMEGGPTLGQILPNLDLGGPLQPNASGAGTGVFINGREIHPQEVLYLQGLFGYVQPGRYWLNWQGIGGYEGGPAMFNLQAAAAASGGSSYTRRTPFGGLGGDGNCSYYMHPSGSSVMNCN